MFQSSRNQYTNKTITAEVGAKADIICDYNKLEKMWDITYLTQYYQL